MQTATFTPEPLKEETPPISVRKEIVYEEPKKTKVVVYHPPPIVKVYSQPMKVPEVCCEKPAPPRIDEDDIQVKR